MIRFIPNAKVRSKRITELIQSPTDADSHHVENKCPVSQVHEDKNCKLMHVFHAMSESGVGVSLRAGALFFIVVALALFFIMATAWTGYVHLLSILVFATATTYLVGGAIVLLRKERKGMLPIFIVNLLDFILLATFFVLYLYSYLTDPCYLNPSSCDDQLTDSPLELRALGVWTGILAVLTYVSWRLQRGHKNNESNE